MDIVDRLENCLNAPAGSVSESETEKAIREAVQFIEQLRNALESVDDLGFYWELLRRED